MNKTIFISIVLLFLVFFIVFSKEDFIKQDVIKDELREEAQPEEIQTTKIEDVQKKELKKAVCGDGICEVDERYENCPRDCKEEGAKEKIFGKEGKKNIFQIIINFFRKLFVKEDKLCKEFCEKNVAHADCVGRWKISGTYPNCLCNFVCGEIVSPPNVLEEELVEEPKEEGIIEEPKEEGAQKPPEKIMSTHNWLMLGHDPEHNSFSDSTAPNDNNIFFSYNADLPRLEEKGVEKDVNSLVFEHNRLYYLFDKFVYALDIPTGNMVWYSDMGELATGIAIANNILFVSAGKKLSALNIDTGNKLWDYETSGEITPPVVSDKIYFGSKDYYLYAIKTDGKLAWKFKVNSEIHSVPSVSNGKVCFGTENVDFSVYCLDANTGKLLWRHTFSTTSATGGEGGMFHAAPAIYNNIVFIGEEGGKRGIRTSGVQTQPAPSSFYALNINTGDIIWDFKASDWIVTVPAIGYGKVYFTTWDENTYAVNMADGKLIWKAKGRSTPAVADGKVFVGSSDTIYSYDASTGKELWKYQSEDIPSFLVVGDGKLYASFTAEDVVKKYQIVGFGKK